MYNKAKFFAYLAEEVVPSEGELLTPGQLTSANNTAEAVNVVGVAPNAHHQISLAEGQMALGALHAKQSEMEGEGREGKKKRRSVKISNLCL